jgi:hypothetical protein
MEEFSGDSNKLAEYFAERVRARLRPSRVRCVTRGLRKSLANNCGGVMVFS